jgi:uncharacterized protein YoaH (UPF0181 family)
MSHNTFDINEIDAGKYEAKSHNFPECVAEGESPGEAIDLMNRKIMYIKDNQPAVYKKNIEDRVSKGLACKCGVKLDLATVNTRKRD